MKMHPRCSISATLSFPACWAMRHVSPPLRSMIRTLEHQEIIMSYWSTTPWHSSLHQYATTIVGSNLEDFSTRLSWRWTFTRSQCLYFSRVSGHHLCNGGSLTWLLNYQKMHFRAFRYVSYMLHIFAHPWIVFEKTSFKTRFTFLVLWSQGWQSPNHTLSSKQTLGTRMYLQNPSQELPSINTCQL